MPPVLPSRLANSVPNTKSEAMATWFTSLGVTTDADQLFITHGGQHHLSIVLGMVAASDDTVLTESYTYSGMLALSAQSGYRLHGVATDALEGALRRLAS